MATPEPEKGGDTGNVLDTIKSNENVNELMDYIMKNKTDALAYVLMFIGILTFVFNQMYGGLLVGFVAGLYYGNVIVDMAKQANRFIDTEGIFKSFVLGGTLLCLAIAAPFLFLGGAAAVGIRAAMTGSTPDKPKEEESAEDSDETIGDE